MSKFYSFPDPIATPPWGQILIKQEVSNPVEEIEGLKNIIHDLAIKMNILMDAVLMSHQFGPDGKCREDCWSCRVQETIRGIQVARKLGAGKP